METDKVLTEAHRLWNEGMAVHWLLPNSKRPVESGWTTGPRADWKHLKESYVPGMNVGVRLGAASEIKKNFLGVIDVDVKSKDAKHIKEVLEKLTTLHVNGNLPQVLSGRGNGSRHYYILTKKPLTPFKAIQSADTVKVHMPSVRPSKRELKSLTKAEIEKGVRLRSAYEISFMGEGQQVVLPPSIHPDSGLAYRWKHGFTPALALDFDESILHKAAGDVKTISQRTSETKTGLAFSLKEKVELFPFVKEVVDLTRVPVSDKIRVMIVKGKGVTNESESLLPAIRALLGSGLTVNQVLNVLTNEDYALGKTAHNHTFNKGLMKAVQWLYKYNVLTVLDKSHLEKRFREAEETKGEEQGSFIDDTTDTDGFYSFGRNGGMIPNYVKLLAHFHDTHPFKTISEMKAVYTFVDTHYEPFTPTDIRGFAEDSFDPKPTEKIRLEFLNKVLANNIVRRDFFLRTTENRLNFKNGVLLLEESFTGPKLIAHSPEFGFRGVLPYDYDPEAKCPFFDKWIASIMLGDQELIAILQEFMGYIVRGGDYKYHKALWLGGIGRNGKSTFVDLLKALIGSGNFSTISIRSLMGDKFAGADLDGKIANFSEETSPQELADSGPFKNLTGDGEIFAQKKYGDPYSFRNRAKLIMTYNTIPDLKDLSAGMLSRPLIIPFRKRIKDEAQDRNIKHKLFAELSGIFNFALAGWERLENQNDFTKSELSAQALRRVREESCNVFQWVEHYVDFLEEYDSYERIKPTQLYEAYRRKENYPFKAVEFYRRLNQHPEIQKRRRKTMGERFYIGLKYGQ